jgi:hypothetical protein
LLLNRLHLHDPFMRFPEISEGFAKSRPGNYIDRCYSGRPVAGASDCASMPLASLGDGTHITGSGLFHGAGGNISGNDV